MSVRLEGAYPKITVCISTYNRANLIERAINMVLSQTYSDFELIVVNDGSVDETSMILEQLAHKDSRIKLISNEENFGLSFSRNKAIEWGVGSWFTFVDDDDLWDSNYLELMYSAAIHTGSDCVFGGFYKNGRSYVYSSNLTSLKDVLIAGYTPPVGSQFYKLSMLKAIGGYNNKIRSGVDHDLWIRLASSADCKVVMLARSIVTPDGVHDDSRIKLTKNPQSRISGINLSLSEWKADLIRIAGCEYYYHFRKEYIYYLQYRFVNCFIKTRDVSIIKALLSEDLTRKRWVNFLFRYLGSAFKAVSKRNILNYEGNCIIEPLFEHFPN